MGSISTSATALALILSCGLEALAARPAAAAAGIASPNAKDTTVLLALPGEPHPFPVAARFALNEINEINDEAQTFDFTGVLTLTWRDPRQAFDPAAAGVGEKIYQGDFQVDQISPAWFPHVNLSNAFGRYDKHGVLLRVQPDGTSTLVQAMNATVKSELDMRKFPFDRHQLEAAFEVLGFDRNQVALRPESGAAGFSAGVLHVPQWDIPGFSTSIRERPTSYAGRDGSSSTFVVSVHVERQPLYILRLICLPLMIIALLSFSVFWMDRSSLGDRISVSFIGILTSVTYLLVVGTSLPRISYFTLIHAFLNFNFLIMCATVVPSLLVGAADKKGHREAGDRIDRRCRWVFPLVYLGLILVMLAAGLRN